MGSICGTLGRRNVDSMSEMVARSEDVASAGYTDDGVSIHATFHPLLADEQPVRTEDGVVLWLIGEVYGFDDRPVGGSTGHEPRPADVDSVTYCARLYERHGLDFVRGLNGNHFGIVYDRPSRQVSLFTDRLASIPIYYARPDPGTVVFSSDVQEVPLHPAVETEFDPGYLHEYLAFKRSFGVKTPLVGIEELQPGAVTTVGLDDGSIEVDGYWRPRHRPRDAPFERFVEEFTDTFTRVIDEWARDDLAYGVLLSGGSDSRLNLAALSPGATAFHMAGWMSREARTAERVALESGNKFVLLRRDEEYQAGALARNRPLTNFNGWFTQAYTTGFEAEITDSVDVLLSGMYADTLFKEHGIPSPTVSLGPVGKCELPLETDIETIDEYVDWLVDGAADDLSLPTDLRSILHENIHREGDSVVHHGVEYDTVRDLVYCSGYYPLTNDDDVIFRNSLRRMIPYRTPFLDDRLIDLSLAMPIRYRLRRNLVDRAVERIDPPLAAIAHAHTGVRLTRPFPVAYAGRLLNSFWRKHVSEEAPPRPHMSNGPWINDAELIRRNDFLERAIDEYGHLADAISGLTAADVRELYRAHLDGENNLVSLYTLMTVLAMPVTARVLDDTVDDERSDSPTAPLPVSDVTEGDSP